MHANTFAQIAELHNEKLCKLREGYEEFQKSIDEKFDEVLVRVNQWLGIESEQEVDDKMSSRGTQQDGFRFRAA